MNQRIVELYKQAAEFAYKNAGDDRGNRLVVDSITTGKFAELIVRECAEVVQEGRWMVPPSQEQLARSIKQHFGVEE